MNSSRALKQQALELLEWALEDMSPVGHLLHFKCGFEREGNFVPDAIPHNQLRHSVMDKMSNDMHALLVHNPQLQYIYDDSSGSFILEGVTTTLSLSQAPQAIESISNEMLRVAPELGVRDAGFGCISAEHACSIVPENEFHNYKGEVFETPEGKILAGRGQHCNLSLWMDDKELFRRKGKDCLVDHAATRGLEWMPYMFLPCRKGNYYRIAAESLGAVTNFKAGDLDGKKAPFILRYTADEKFRSFKDGTYRLEFRAAAPEADPWDVALAAATPLVKACDEAFVSEEGKIKLDTSGNHLLKMKTPFPSEGLGSTPRDEAQAAAIFNSPENPYFTYLDELAERKIAKTRKAFKETPGVITRQACERAEKLKGIGSKLFVQYCKEFHLTPCIDFPITTQLG